MGWSFRKSIGFGPVRLNLSKRGVGVSTGVRGLRVGMNAKGNAYVNAGRGGVMYRKEFGHGRATAGGSPAPAARRTNYFRWVVLAAAVLFVLVSLYLGSRAKPAADEPARRATHRQSDSRPR